VVVAPIIALICMEPLVLIIVMGIVHMILIALTMSDDNIAKDSIKI
jgi:hypothetical protein